jgi:integrase
MQNFLDYRPAHLVKGRGNFYVAYSVTNPETGKLTVKRIKLNYIKSIRQRKEYAEELIKQVNTKYPSSYYIIGHDFAPSENKCSDRRLRAKWLQIRKALKMPTSYQFYSLKDTGITKMISILNVSEVRDQARHSSIAITDVYTDRSKTNGNDHIKKLDF